MKQTERIRTELKNNQWPNYTQHPFVEEVLIKTVSDYMKDSDKTVSQIWGLRLNEKGELTSEYELLTLTDNHLISVFSDLNNDKDKVHIFSQSLKNIHKFSAQPSTLHKGYVRINVILKGVAWSFESNDKKAIEHFNKNLDQLIIRARKENEDDLAKNLLNDDDSNRTLRTIHADFLEPKEKKTQQRNKKNFELIKKYAKNNILWYSIAIVGSIAILVISAVYLGLINETANFEERFSANTLSLIIGGAFVIVFGLLNFISYLMLTMKVWDKEKFSRNLYRVLLQLISSLIIVIFGVLMVTKLNPTGYNVALYTLPTAVILLFDGIYLITKAHNDLNQTK